MKKKTAPSAPRSNFDGIIRLVEGLQTLQAQVADSLAPEVDGIIRSKCRDAARIEHALDTLLDACGHPRVLALFRRLCRHYFYISPVVTAEYIHLYRDTWEPESLPPAPAQRTPKPRAKR
ncbi:MAG TPA: hypothetical protein PK490_00275 [Prosthecobacter sp.]|nr:hypothetical protein [Prosthecobacter sp.]HRK12686.1 hypothetical protein [Prosthecobacter sp.]